MLSSLALRSQAAGAPLAAVKSLDTPNGPLSQVKSVLERLVVALTPRREDASRGISRMFRPGLSSV